MESVARYALPVLIAVTSLGAFVMCILVFRFGLPGGDEEPETRGRSLWALRFGHAFAAIMFAVAAVLGVAAARRGPMFSTLTVGDGPGPSVPASTGPAVIDDGVPAAAVTTPPVSPAPDSGGAPAAVAPAPEQSAPPARPAPAVRLPEPGAAPKSQPRDERASGVAERPRPAGPPPRPFTAGSEARPALPPTNVVPPPLDLPETERRPGDRSLPPRRDESKAVDEPAEPSALPAATGARN